MRRPWVLLAVVAAVAITARLGASGGGQQNPQQPTFRSAVILVPVDVRVVDNKTGKPVNDLTQENFTVLEDGAKQVIGQFTPNVLGPEGVVGAASKAKMAIRQSAFDLGQSNKRTFLFMLGRGRLQEPSRGLDALEKFIRTQLLPQDQISLFAYDRATDFTTDHEQIAQLVDRLKTAHLDINMRVDAETQSGLAGLYGSKKLPANVRAKIDAVFQGSGALGSRTLEGKLPGQTANQVDADTRKATDAMQRAELAAVSKQMNEGTNIPPMSLTQSEELESSAFSDLPLDEFVNRNAQTLQDLSSIYACIEYLRHFEGEKHLVFLTERGLSLPRREEDEYLAMSANDARVVLDTFQTGGVKPQIGGTPTAGIWDETMAYKILRTIAEETGGVSSIAENGTVAMDRINTATMTGYQLGYYPSNGNWDGAYRKITIKVNRPDTTVFFRHGYFARRDIASFNRRNFITTQRITSAINFRREISDIKLKLSAGISKAESGGGYVLKVAVKIDMTNLAFTVENGIHIGRVDIAIMASDQDGNVVANNYQNADLKLTEEVFQRIKKDGIPYSATIPVSPSARNVRVVVYDYKADLIGRADASVF